METKNIMIVGVGGQGSLLASKLLGSLLTDEGYDVKVSEVHGMSQRGGSVVTYVRYGSKVYSPIIASGEADFIVSFEKLEAARYAECLKKQGKIIVNTQSIDLIIDKIILLIPSAPKGILPCPLPNFSKEIRRFTPTMSRSWRSTRASMTTRVTHGVSLPSFNPRATAIAVK